MTHEDLRSCIGPNEGWFGDLYVSDVRSLLKEYDDIMNALSKLVDSCNKDVPEQPITYWRALREDLMAAQAILKLYKKERP